MIKRLAIVVLLFLLAGAVASAAEEQVSAAKWLETRFSSISTPPFSFKYDGKSSASFLKSWPMTHEEKQLDAVRTQHVYTFTDPKTGLRIAAECIVYSDFPAVEWLLRIKNTSGETSPIIEDIQALDSIFTSKEKDQFVLHHALGGSVTRSDFAPIDTPLRSVKSIRLSTNGGRPSDITALPFFNLEDNPAGGTMIAIGWTGQWAATFERESETSVRVTAGMARSHFKLFANEEVRTPRILLLFWDGPDYLAGQNAFRRIILAHYSPQANGKTAQLPFSFSVHGTYGFNDTTEEKMVDLAKIAAEKFKNIGFEYFWIDAGWYEGGWPDGVGNLFADPKRYPNGLAPIGKAAADNGYKFLLWIEPERVHKDTAIFNEHPAWVLKVYNNFSTGLFNLGNPKARAWLTDSISDIIDTANISIYRQDFNMDPIKYWQVKDTPTRQGITEIRYVEGLYKFWDELVRRHPGLLIDNCASGGRRFDLETVSRSVALWRTDYADGKDPYIAEGFQSQTYGLQFWFPTGSTGTGTLDQYHFRSTMANGMVVSWNPIPADFPIKQAEKLAAEFHRARGFYFGDYYPLTSYSTASDVWIAYQFHRVDQRAGMVVAFRRRDSREQSLKVRLRGLDPDAKYELEFSGTGVKKTATGKELADAFTITLDKTPDSAIVFYKQK